MEFLLELLRDERQKRIEAENELIILRSILEPLQKKELEHCQVSKANKEKLLVKPSTDNHGAMFNKKICSNDKKITSEYGKLVCDCDCDNENSYDEVD